ncbi:hypothetical protein AYO44_00395 [Planctomycetaceae bacterium SCGC AG-212-F19]|nr:hypothetical protein AYO44_00395 [Planctomycetaceae bacterium SCGC AG-212-F19]
MSDVTSRYGPTPHPTRQQLAELEALMQRMLSLPVNQLDAEAEAALPTLLPGPAVVDALEPGPTVPSEPSHLPPPDVVADTVPSSAARVDERVHIKAQAPIVVSKRPFPSILARSAPWRRVRADWLGPILWINRVFDAWTTRLGRPGRWLRSRHGRALLGALGILFLAAAIGCAILGVVGWTW